MAIVGIQADGVTVAQVQVLMRADDPLFELAMLVFGHRMEDRHWQLTLHVWVMPGHGVAGDSSQQRTAANCWNSR